MKYVYYKIYVYYVKFLYEILTTRKLVINYKPV